MATLFGAPDPTLEDWQFIAGIMRPAPCSPTSFACPSDGAAIRGADVIPYGAQHARHLD